MRTTLQKITQSVCGMFKPSTPRASSMIRALCLAVMTLSLSLAAVLDCAAQPSPPDKVLNHRGFKVDIAGLAQFPDAAAVIAALRRQIDICADSRVPPATLAFFQSVPLQVKIIRPGEPGFNAGSGFYSRGKDITLKAEVYPFDNPVLLHELLHAYHHQRLPDANRNAAVLSFYERARTTPGLFPPGSYMLSNVNEYFAMTASVFLHGVAARPPSTRDNLRAKQPVYYNWLEREFGAR